MPPPDAYPRVEAHGTAGVDRQVAPDQRIERDVIAEVRDHLPVGSKEHGPASVPSRAVSARPHHDMKLASSIDDAEPASGVLHEPATAANKETSLTA